mmetsp:Transcript_21344/g.63961  ORF Transcript_21344/g.63961 Transcript_21344/m.63961 type:complete len:274 (-) Transcript_21344:1800-2621(-)
MTIASFSRPWKPSTLLTSSAFATLSGRSSLSSATCALYGVMIPIDSGAMPAAIRRSTWAMTAFASPRFVRLSPSSSCCSSKPQPVVSINSSTGRNGLLTLEPVFVLGTFAGFLLLAAGASVSRSARQCSATELCAVRCPSYNSSEDHCMIALFMRYCTLSIWLTPAPYKSCMRSKSVRANPRRAAISLIIVGGSCRWSPANTHRGAFNKAPQHAASSACAASSMTTTSNTDPSSEWCKAPVNVAVTTCALLSTSTIAACWRFRSSLASLRSSP